MAGFNNPTTDKQPIAMSSLFKLRGELSPRETILLTIAGIIILLLLWHVLAVSFAKENIVVDESVPEASITDRAYFESDSLLREHLPALLQKTPAELSALGLRKETVYPTLPPPLHVLRAFKELYLDDKLVYNSAKSIQLNLLGYLAAILIAIPFGFIIGLVPLFRGLFSKLVDATRFIPLTAVTGIFVVWFGLESGMKIAFLAFGIIVYLIPVTVQRIDEVEDVYLQTVFTLGASNWQTIRTVYLPSVLSRLSDDVRVLTAISWTYITIAEMLNRSGGIGELIWVARRQSRVDKAFAVLVVIVIIGIVQDRLFVWLDRKLFPFKYQAKGQQEKPKLGTWGMVASFALKTIFWVFAAIYILLTINSITPFLSEGDVLGGLFGDTIWMVHIIMFSIIGYNVYSLFQNKKTNTALSKA